MKKDIEIPIAKDIDIAAVYEYNEDEGVKVWNAYIINNGTLLLDMLMVVSKGYNGEQKTSTMRHNLGVLEAKSFRKVELLQEAIFTLNNEFFVTFFADNKLYEKKFVFKKDTINEEKVVP
ncbi:MAG: hypothetical protein NWQ38_03845, partial [Cellulophaga sp.]|nr:hypothetical protein [Cellulophaga sp.]